MEIRNIPGMAIPVQGAHHLAAPGGETAAQSVVPSEDSASITSRGGAKSTKKPAEAPGRPVVGELPRMRARDLGIKIGIYPPGKLNAITDVKGVRVGGVTISEGDGPLVPGKGPIRTGVTAILPHSGDLWDKAVMAGNYILNGNGEVAGLTWLQESGRLEMPILLTNTLNVGKVADAAVSWAIRRHPEMGVTDDVPISMVAECDDSTLNDAQGRHVRAEDVFKAIENATSGPVEEGSTGAGTGMICYEFKGGIGTSSRVLPAKEGGYSVGVLTLTNFGSRRDLQIAGVPVGREITEGTIQRTTEGSLVTVIATDAPLSPGQLNRLARRASLGMARTGAVGHHGSGDVFIAFSTANTVPRNCQGFTYPVKFLNDDRLDPIYEATEEATEEAIINSMTTADTVTGRDGNTATGIPLDRLKDTMKKYGRLSEK